MGVAIVYTCFQVMEQIQPQCTANQNQLTGACVMVLTDRQIRYLDCLCHGQLQLYRAQIPACHVNIQCVLYSYQLSMLGNPLRTHTRPPTRWANHSEHSHQRPTQKSALTYAGSNSHFPGPPGLAGSQTSPRKPFNTIGVVYFTGHMPFETKNVKRSRQFPKIVVKINF